jgi:hypothetical protein
MSITVSRLLPIQNGFVKVPRGEIRRAGRLRVKDALDAIPGSRVVQISPTSRRYVDLSSVEAGTDEVSWGLFDYNRYDFYVELPANDSRSHTSQDDDFAELYDLTD